MCWDTAKGSFSDKTNPSLVEPPIVWNAAATSSHRHPRDPAPWCACAEPAQRAAWGDPPPPPAFWMHKGDPCADAPAPGHRAGPRQPFPGHDTVRHRSAVKAPFRWLVTPAGLKSSREFSERQLLETTQAGPCQQSHEARATSEPRPAPPHPSRRLPHGPEPRTCARASPGHRELGPFREPRPPDWPQQRGRRGRAGGRAGRKEAAAHAGGTRTHPVTEVPHEVWLRALTRRRAPLGPPGTGQHVNKQ